MTSKLACFVVLMLLMSSCVGHQQLPDPPLSAGPFWPDNGQPVRIRFAASFNRPEELNIKQGIWSRLWDLLAGNAQRRLSNPMGISTDMTGTLYLVDAVGKQVKVFDRKNKSYRTLPDDDAPLQTPIMPLADTQTQRLYITDAAAGVVRIVPLASDGSPGELGKGLLNRPTGITLNPLTGELLVLDTRLGTVFRFDRKSLVLKGRFGGIGNGPGQMNRPTDLAVNRSGEIVVCDALNFRVQLFTADGQFLRAFGKPGDSPGYFSRPRGLAVDSDNNIYVLDNLFDNVQIFDAQGRLLLAFGGHGQEQGQFWMPSAIHIDQRDWIYVSDTYNRRVQIFQYLKKAIP